MPEKNFNFFLNSVGIFQILNQVELNNQRT